MSANAGPAVANATPPLLQASGWGSIAGLVHGFFGRDGGCSAGDWASLNVSERVGDAPAAVEANWERASRAFPGVAWVRMRQAHGLRVAQIARVDHPVGEADGMLTAAAGLGLAVLTADCVPILCVAPAARAVMALHAGWRGTLGGIISVGLGAAERWLGVDPSSWRVALGPSIGGCCYEVETHLGAQFIERWGAMPDAWQPNGTHGQLDLRAANRHILLAHGLPAAQIATVGPCTSCHSGGYFSHRRSGGRTGRQLSVIGWSV